MHPMENLKKLPKLGKFAPKSKKAFEPTTTPRSLEWAIPSQIRPGSPASCPGDSSQPPWP